MLRIFMPMFIMSKNFFRGDNMILIHQGYVSEADGVSTLTTEIDINGEKKDVRLSVAAEYGKFLSPERADYGLVGMLRFALRTRQDIICKAPVTEELLYNIREILIPTLVRSDPRNYHVKIQADIAPPLDKLPVGQDALGGGVGTGISCGVDSFYTVLKHVNSEYPSRRLTHLCIFNNGSINLGCYRRDLLYVKQKVFERAENVAAEINLPLLKLESNFQDVIPQDHYLTHTYMDALAIYAMQKLWRVYYYSSGLSFKDFSLEKNLKQDPAHFDALLLDCFSISKLRIISCGGEGDRNDKVDFIADNPIAQKYLHVCIRKAFNCGVCSKCLRTLLSFDAAGKLDNFRQSFNIDAYIKNRNKAYMYLFDEIKKDPNNSLFAKSYKVLYARHKNFFDELNRKREQLQSVGYYVNTLPNFDASYDPCSTRKESRLIYAMEKLIDGCASLLDVGCRKTKFVKSVCPDNVKYYPVDFKAHDSEVIACDFKNGNFPDVKIDTCLCALTAEYVEHLPQFLASMCNAAQKQILMWCRPADKERYARFRREHPFLTDFTEKFLIDSMTKNGFRLSGQFPASDNPSVILYDFRKISDK